MKIALFIPCYNVKKSVLGVLENIPSPDQFSHIYLVDNNSTDGTRDVLEQYMKTAPANTHLLLNEKNYSLGGSSIIAFQKALEDKNDFLICMHSDGQADPNDLEKFFPLDLSFDFVFGSRMMKDSKTSEYSRLRQLGNLFFARLQQWILGQPIYDIGAFVAFNLRTIESISYFRIRADMSYHPTLVLYIATQRKIKCREFPIYWGKVEQSSVNIWRYGFEHLGRIFRLGFGFYTLSNQKLKDFQYREIKSVTRI